MRKRLLLVSAAAAAIAVAGVTVTAVADPATENAEAAATRDDDSFDPEALDAALVALQEAGVPAAIAEVKHGDDAWSGSEGSREIGGDEAAEPTDQMRIGSLTKTMLTTVLFELADAGEVDPDAPVADYLPGLLPYEEPITIRQLLSHTSGVPDYFFDVYPSLAEGTADSIKTNRLLELTPEEMIATATSRPLEFEPGSKWSYSNTGYYVLGLLLEELTGETVESLLQSQVFDPTGLEDTYISDSETVIAGPHPTPYFATAETDEPYVNTDELSPTHMWAAGGVVSTASETNGYFRELFEGNLMSPERLAEAMTLTDQSGGAYGQGMQAVPAECAPVDGGIAYGHTGGTLGHSTYSFHSPDGNRQVTLIMNLDPQQSPDAEVIGTALNDFLVAGLCSQTGNDTTAPAEPLVEAPDLQLIG